MLAMELKGSTADIIARSFERGVLVISAGHGGQVLRFLPPLVITEEQLDRALTVIEEEVARD